MPGTNMKARNFFVMYHGPAYILPSMISVETAPSLSTVPVDLDLLRSLLQEVAAVESDRSVALVSVILGPHALVRKLNVAYLDHDYNTDVLAFNLSEAPDAPLEGEIYVDVETAHERHAEFDTTVEHEVVRYAVHGLLHLLGHTDKTPAGQSEMRTLEDHYVEQFATRTSSEAPASNNG